MFGFSDEFEVLASLCYHLRCRGLNISGIGESNYAHLFGLHTYPDYIMSPNIVNDYDRVIKFNRYILNMEYREKPDIILIQLPDGLMKFNDVIPNSFGIKSYIVTQSVKGDYFICCAPNDGYGQLFWKNVRDKLLHRFEISIDYVHLSNKAIYYPESIEEQTFSIYRVPLDRCFISMHHSINAEDDIKVNNLFINGAMKKLIEDIMT